MTEIESAGILITLIMVFMDFFMTILLHIRIRSNCCCGEVFLEPIDSDGQCPRKQPNPSIRTLGEMPSL